LTLDNCNCHFCHDFAILKNRFPYVPKGTTDYQCTPAPLSLQGTAVAPLYFAGGASRPELRISSMRALIDLSEEHVLDVAA
jgi:hypothetical protein